MEIIGIEEILRYTKENYTVDFESLEPNEQIEMLIHPSVTYMFTDDGKLYLAGCSAFSTVNYCDGSVPNNLSYDFICRACEVRGDMPHRMNEGGKIHQVPLTDDDNGVQTVTPNSFRGPNNDAEPLIDAIHAINDAMQDGNNVLVHCTQGTSRSPTIVAAYLMAKYDLTADYALEFVKRRRPFANPLVHVKAVLYEFHDLLKGHLCELTKAV